MGAGLPDQHAPRLDQSRPYRGILERDSAGEQCAARFRGNSCRVDQVLDGYRYAEQRPVISMGEGCLGLGGLPESGIGRNRGKGVDLTTDRLDPRQQPFDHLDRREVSAAIPGGKFGDT